MTDRKLLTYRKYNHLVRTLVKYGCCHTYDDFGILSYSLSGVAIFGNIIRLLNCINASYYYRNDLSVVMKQVGRAFGFISIITKMICFLWYRIVITKFNQLLHHFFEEELARSEEIKAVMLYNVNEYYVPTCIFTAVMISIIFVYHAPVFYNIIYQLVHLQIPKNYGFPSRTLYWWPVPDGIIYHLHYVFELYDAWFIIFVVCGVDTLFAFYAYQMSAVLRAMTFRLENPLSNEDVIYLLKASVDKYKKLLACKKTMEDFYGPIVIWPIITNALIMCSLVYEALPFSDLTVGKFMMLFFFMALKIIQTFIYTCYGTNIASASDEFRQGIYCSRWPNAIAERHLKSTMILTLMQESMSMKVMKICPISMETFSAVIKTTVSYFFLLQSVQKR